MTQLTTSHDLTTLVTTEVTTLTEINRQKNWYFWRVACLEGWKEFCLRSGRRKISPGGYYWGYTSMNSRWTVGWTLNHKLRKILFRCKIVSANTKNLFLQKCQIVCPYFVTQCSKITGPRPWKPSVESKMSIFFGALEKSIAPFSEFAHITHIHCNIILLGATHWTCNT
jgi:hypothetical protein